MTSTRREFLLQSGSVLAGGILLRPAIPNTAPATERSAALPAIDTNGVYIETWLGKMVDAICIASYSFADGSQHLLVADASGLVHPLTIGPPGWTWAWADPIGSVHAGIAGLAAYFNSGDGRHHCFIALESGDVFEVSFLSLANRVSFTEIWIAKLEGGATGIAGFPTSDKSQHLFVVGKDGLVHPLEIGAASGWTWTWREAITAHHDEIVGVSAHWHPFDNAQHLFVVLRPGDVWEARSVQGGPWAETWLGVHDGGASALAGHSAANGTQHLFAAGAPGGVLPLQIGAPHWKWRWDDPVLPRRGAIVGLASHFHPGDKQQHVIALLQSGDIWESRFQLRTQVATREWSSNEFPISYWDGPRGLNNLQLDYQRVAEANFTVAMPSNAGGDIDSNRALLGAAGAAGLKMFLMDGLVQSFRASSGLRPNDKQALQAVIDNYSGHSAFAGYQLVGQNGTDELFPNDFAINAELVAFFRSNDPGHECFLEIIAEYGNAAYEPLTYDQYVESYLSTVRPAVLCFHNYSLQADFPTSFYNNLRTIRTRALAHNVPFWQFVLSMGHGGFRPPTEAELRRQAMQVLAFGGTGVLWFTYVEELDNNGVPWGPAIVDVKGTPLPLYPEVQRVNADVRTVGGHLLNAQSIAVYESDPVTGGGGMLAPKTGRVVLENAANVTIGMFSVPVLPKSSSAITFLVMIASRDADHPVVAKLTFVAFAVRMLDKASGVWKAVGIAAGPKAWDVEILLAPGDAELFVLSG